MEDIIKKILDVEDRAEQIIEDAEKDKSEMEKELDAKINQLRGDIECEKAKELSDYQKKENEKQESRIAEINESLEKQKVMLKDRYERLKDDWTDSIFKEIFS